MKYYDSVPENFLLIRLVATRNCNYRCHYCYVSLEKRMTKKDMFSHHSAQEWLQSLKDNFSGRKLEFYFTGGEPLIVEDCITLIRELAKWDNVKGIRIDSNLSNVERFLGRVNSKKIRFLSAFHPTQIPLEEFLEKAKLVQRKGMLDMVNFVASKENLGIVKMTPHELIKRFGSLGIFLNIARDFGQANECNYEKNYKKYVDSLQYPLDSSYMDFVPLNKGVLCGGGKHYITINRHGQIFSCGGEKQRKIGHGNIFEQTAELPTGLQECQESRCPSIISYSFSCSNQFLPVDHTQDYVKRCNATRESLPEKVLNDLWNKVNIDRIHKKDWGLSLHKKIVSLKRKLRSKGLKGD